MSWRVEVVADSSGQWATNGMRYRTRADAEAAGRDIASRWFAVKEWRVVESSDEPNTWRSP
jgi:hypothetical protein